MIRINLLGIKKEVAGPPTVSMEGAKLTVLFVVFLLLGVGVLVVDYMNIASKKAALDERMAAAQAEKARLEGVKREYDQNEQRRQMLSRCSKVASGSLTG